MRAAGVKAGASSSRARTRSNRNLSAFPAAPRYEKPYEWSISCSISTNRRRSSAVASLHTAAYLLHSASSGGSSLRALRSRRSDLPLSTFLASQGNSRALRYLHPAESAVFPIRLARSRRTSVVSFISTPPWQASIHKPPSGQTPPVSGLLRDPAILRAPRPVA